MTSDAWRRKIKGQCERAGTYRPEFNSPIDALAKILEQRDRAYAQFIEEGAELLVLKISDRGAENNVRNPLLQIWQDLNTQALAYWRDLGLTPAGLKKIDEEAMKKKKESALARALRELA